MATIHCRCYACGTALRVSQQHAGRKAKCPKCAAAIVIPPPLADQETAGAKSPIDTSPGESSQASAGADVPARADALPGPPEEPDHGFPHVSIDLAEPGDRPRPGSAAARVQARKRDRTMRLAMLITAAVTALAVVAVGAFLMMGPRDDSAAKAAPQAPAPGPKSAPGPEKPRPAEPPPGKPADSMLVLDWPEDQRAGSTVYVDDSEHAVPGSGLVQFVVSAGEHRITIMRRGYEHVEIRMNFEPGGHHHYDPRWSWKEIARADPEVEKPGPPQTAPEEQIAGKSDAEGPESAKAGPGEKALTAGEPAKPTPESIPATYDDPEEFLQSKGLIKRGDHFALPEESQLSKHLRDAQRRWQDVLRAQRELGKSQLVVDQGSAVMIGYVQQRGDLGARLQFVTTVEDNNRLVGAINEIEARMVVTARQLEEAKKTRDQARAVALSTTGEFEQDVLAFREVYDKLRDGYQDLAVDPAVSQAIEQVSQASPKPYRLGPGILFVGTGKKLEALERKVFSEAVPIRRGEGNQWYVSVMFNGKHTQEMAIDTGASVIALSLETAQAVGLAPGPDAPTVYAQMADGRVVPGSRVIAGTVRVGKFEAKDVECHVMAAGQPGATPLLGMSFFNHFNFKIDQGNGRLIMSQIDTSPTDEP